MARTRREPDTGLSADASVLSLPGATSPLDRLATPKSQGDMVLKALSRAIREGRLEPGSLHSAASLAEQLGVSRTPVREALLQLARDGAVRLERNRGARILQTSMQDLRDIFQIRTWLEVPATRIAAETRTDADLARLAESLTVLQEGELTTQDIRRQDHNFHVTLMEIAGNTRLSQYVDTLRSSVLIHDAMNVEQQQRLHSQVVDEHRPILEAIRDRDADAAADHMAKHLDETARVLMQSAAE
ncbi:GntR family transcriptional regulator [Amycolatopsis rhabdoformis]|uniref:GntR family transcriptional regulator n=1 Tax=Amycolatopsis rhabdoformis TaxID=1448059 RepID=A0ABZ1IBQ3_9PSEU|nr:GntR family transcriptional regulator [Amycolatopsis rhabdoformis]WSE31906.1 GntR family transcriptional regulator [Amycolatopsis rhabdoformis]